MRDKLRALELEYPPLKYTVLVTNEIMYSMVVCGFLRDIASDDDYEIYEVNNWWDDLGKCRSTLFLSFHMAACIWIVGQIEFVHTQKNSGP
jgi:hypothetical protein